MNTLTFQTAVDSPIHEHYSSVRTTNKRPAWDSAVSRIPHLKFVSHWQTGDSPDTSALTGKRRPDTTWLDSGKRTPWNLAAAP